MIPLERELEVPDDALPIPPARDELDEAVDLVADTIEAAGQDRPVPSGFPRELIRLFEGYGETLKPGEWMEQRPHGNGRSVRYDLGVREHLTRLGASAYEDTISVIGAVTMARVSRPRMAIMVDDGREVEATFRPEDEDLITTALKEHSTMKVKVEGRGEFSADGRLDKFIIVDRLTLMAGEDAPFDAAAQPIWVQFEQILSTVPETDLRQLPSDAAEQHDHYLYGTPKRVG